MKLAENEYIDPVDGLLHCKKGSGQRQTVVPRFEKPRYFMPRCICRRQREAEEQARPPKNDSAAWSVSGAGKPRACKTAICATALLLITTAKIL